MGNEHDTNVQARILFIDDEESILSSFKRVFRREGYEVFTTSNPDEAFEKVSELEFDLIVTDQRMPIMEGVEVLKRMIEVSPFTTRVMLTGYADIHAAIEAVNEGKIFRFLSKPWNEEELKGVIRQGVDQTRLLKENQRLLKLTLFQNEELNTLNADLEARVTERTKQLSDANARLEKSFLECVKVMGGMAEYSGALPNGHSKRVAKISGGIVREMSDVDLSPKEFLDIQIAAYLHDIGKVGLQNTAFNEHPQRAAQVVQLVPGMESIARLVLHHHEHFSGDGFPRGLKGEEIPLGARVIAVADHYDNALNRGASTLSPRQVVNQLRERVGTEFDPRIVNALETYLMKNGQLEGDAVEVELDLYELSPGMVTSRPVRTRDGFVLLGADFKLDQDTLRRLWRRHVETPVVNDIFVYRRSALRA